MSDIQNEAPRPAPIPEVLRRPRPAALWRRLLAVLIDLGPLAILCTPSMALIFWLEMALPVPSSVLAVIFVPLMWLACGLYFVLLETSTFRATLGKMALGLRLSTADGERVSYARAWWRLFLMLACLCVFPISLVAALIDTRRRALHDMGSGCVVTEEGPAARWRLPEKKDVRPVPSPDGITARGGVRE